jgi:hypothetical protein
MLGLSRHLILSFRAGAVTVNALPIARRITADARLKLAPEASWRPGGHALVVTLALIAAACWSDRVTAIQAGLELDLDPVRRFSPAFGRRVGFGVGLALKAARVLRAGCPQRCRR